MRRVGKEYVRVRDSEQEQERERLLSYVSPRGTGPVLPGLSHINIGRHAAEF